jgi:membrane protease YdiL (CAAX protease family)
MSRSANDTRSSSRPRFAAMIRARPLAWYFGLTYTVSWLCWIPTLVGGGPLIDPHTHAPVLSSLPGIVLGPTGVGLLMTAVVSGRAGLRDLARRITNWRVGARWYAVAILVIPLGEMAVTAAFGQSSIWAALTPQALALYLPAYAAHVYFGPLFEETGWRGFALPRLQQRHGPLRASLILGTLWAGWHFFLYVPSYFRSGVSVGLINLALFVVSTVAMTFLFTWLANHTRASILLAMLLHGSFDGTGTYYAVLAEHHLLPADSAGNAGGLASVVLCVILAVALVVLTKKRLGYHDQPAASAD